MTENEQMMSARPGQGWSGQPASSPFGCKMCFSSRGCQNKDCRQLACLVVVHGRTRKYISYHPLRW